LIRGRGISYIREASPPFDSPLVFSPSKEGGGRILKRGASPLLDTLLLRRVSEAPMGGWVGKQRLLNKLTSNQDTVRI